MHDGPNTEFAWLPAEQYGATRSVVVAALGLMAASCGIAGFAIGRLTTDVPVIAAQQVGRQADGERAIAAATASESHKKQAERSTPVVAAAPPPVIILNPGTADVARPPSATNTPLPERSRLPSDAGDLLASANRPAVSGPTTGTLDRRDAGSPIVPDYRSLREFMLRQ